MGAQLIPPPELTPPSIRHLPLEKRIQLWAELVDESESLLVAGLKARTSSAAEFKQAYRDWLSRHNDDRNRMIPLMADRSRRRGLGHGK